MVPPGAIVPFAGAAAPTGWLLCYGQAVSRTTYAALFTAIGTGFGAGDGTTTFNLPDLRGRMALGLDNMGGSDAGRLSVANTLGASGGSQTKSGATDGYALTTADIPAHVHYMQGGSGGSGSSGATTAQVSPGTGTAPGNAPTSSTGSGGAHSHTISNLDVLPPYMLLNHIIKV
jgi:microcystin-dependent protein